MHVFLVNRCNCHAHSHCNLYPLKTADWQPKARPRATRGARRAKPVARVLIPLGYLHTGKGKHQRSRKFINDRGRMAMHGWSSYCSKKCR
jgi:hypothetical protein